jgi:RNA recognition motif-containing protein
VTWTATEEDLTQRFDPFGPVEQARIATDRDTGRSRGFGFVEMPDATEAQAAIDELNGTSHGGRPHSTEFSGGEVQACTDSPPKSGFVG